MLENYAVFYDALWGKSDGFRSIWYGAKGCAPNKSMWFVNNSDAISFIEGLDKNKFNIYHSCAVFNTSKRTQANVKNLKAIWLDLDLNKVTDKQKFSTVESLLAQILKLKNAPLFGNSWIVFSGHGYHFYWIFEEALTPDEWKRYANYLKNLCLDFGIQGVDFSVISDSARILRVFDTFNLKTEPIKVELKKSGKLLAKFDVPNIADKTTSKATSKVSYSKEDLEANEFIQNLNYIESDASLIAEKCSVIKEFKENGWDSSEPIWYAALAVVLRCKDGEHLAHEFSSKSPRYDETETSQKIAQLKEKNIGPSLCETFIANGCCVNCPYVKKIKSPIQLGIDVKPIENACDDAVDEKEKNRIKEFISLAPSKNWKIGKEGIYRIIDDIPVLVSTIPFFIVDLICEDAGDTTIVTAVIKSFRDKKVDTFKLPLKFIGDEKKLLCEFNSRRIFPSSKKHLKDYLSSYALNLNHVKPQQAINALGWQGDDMFVFNSSGDAVTVSGDHINCVLDRKMYGFAQGYEKKGRLSNWAKIMEFYNSDDKFLPHLFSLLCSLGTPLLPLTSAKGFMLSLQGRSGTGKTLAHKVAMSCWGNPEIAGLLGTYDTHKAMLGRLGVAKNLPLRLDEATLLKPQQLTGLIFEIVNGRGRARATIDGSLSNTASDWQTLTLVTTNKPILEQDVNTVSEAERCRILEISVDMPLDMMVIGKKIGSIIEGNYGVIAKPFVEYVVQNKDRLEDDILDLSNEFQKFVELDKRFWVTCGAVAFVAAKIALELKLLSFDYDRCYNWFVQILKDQKTINKEALTMSRGFETKEEFIHALYDSLSGHIVTMNSRHDIIKTPEREIKARIVEHSSNERIFYVSIPVVKAFVNKHFIDSYIKVLSDYGIEPAKHKRFKASVMRCFEFKL